jgi:hypothetical protein
MPCSTPADVPEPPVGNAAALKQPPASASLAVAKAQLRSLWNLIGARQAPFDVEIVSTRTADGYRTDEMYLTSRRTPDGPDRIFCTYSRPQNPEPRVPAYIDLTGGRDIAGVEWLARRYRGAVLDVEWRSPDLKHHTKWARPAASGIFGMTEPLDDNFNTMFVTGVRRAIDFLQSQPGIDGKRIALGGGSMGGWYSLFVAGVDRRVACVYDVYAAGGGVANFSAPLSAEQRRIWTEAFDPISYARRTRASTLLYLGTNDFFFSLGNAMNEYARLPGEKRMTIIPNWNHNFGQFGRKAPDVDKAWIDHCFHGDPAFPTVTEPEPRPQQVARTGGGAYVWRADGPFPIKRSVLCWSPGTAAWTARYWVEIPAAQHGHEWSASVPERFAGLSATLFVTVIDEKDRTVSSRLVTQSGIDPRTAAGPLWSENAAWDVDRGAAAWRLPGPARSSAFWSQEVTPAGSHGIQVTPTDAAGKIALLTNSVLLASGRAAEYAGFRLSVDGHGSSGELAVSLERDSGDATGIAYTRHVPYGAGETEIRIPWADFKGPEGAPMLPYPFDGLRLDGDRAKGSPLTIEAVDLYR